LAAATVIRAAAFSCLLQTDLKKNLAAGQADEVLL
jgi:hypothetical protein